LQKYSRLTIRYQDAGWITLDERDYIQQQILRTGRYEPEVWDTLFSFAVQNEVVWDIGANCGSFAIESLLDHRVAALHLFEPDPLHAAILRLNLGLNSGPWTVHQLALSDKSETRDFYHASFPHTGGSTLAGDQGSGVFRVDCRTADSLVFESNVAAPTLVKMDVEGWEGLVFRGANRLLSEKPPRAIVFEGDSDDRGELQNATFVVGLNELGYEVSWIRRYDGNIYHRENYLARLRLRQRAIT
jgi:FkbM family methyltransferase